MRDRQRVVGALHHHAERIADEQDVDAGLDRASRANVASYAVSMAILSRSLLHLGEGVDGDLLGPHSALLLVPRPGTPSPFHRWPPDSR